MFCHCILLHLNCSQSIAGIQHHTLRKRLRAPAATAQPTGILTGQEHEWRVSWSWTEFSLLPSPQQAKLAQAVRGSPECSPLPFVGLRKTRKMGVSVGQERPHYRATNSLYRGAAATKTPGTICMCNHVHFDSGVKTEHAKRSGGCRTFPLLAASSPLLSRFLPVSHCLCTSKVTPCWPLKLTSCTMGTVVRKVAARPPVGVSPEVHFRTLASWAPAAESSCCQQMPRESSDLHC